MATAVANRSPATTTTAPVYNVSVMTNIGTLRVKMDCKGGVPTLIKLKMCVLEQIKAQVSDIKFSVSTPNGMMFLKDDPNLYRVGLDQLGIRSGDEIFLSGQLERIVNRDSHGNIIESIVKFKNSSNNNNNNQQGQGQSRQLQNPSDIDPAVLEAALAAGISPAELQQLTGNNNNSNSNRSAVPSPPLAVASPTSAAPKRRISVNASAVYSDDDVRGALHATTTIPVTVSATVIGNNNNNNNNNNVNARNGELPLNVARRPSYTGEVRRNSSTSPTSAATQQQQQQPRRQSATSPEEQHIRELLAMGVITEAEVQQQLAMLQQHQQRQQQQQQQGQTSPSPRSNSTTTTTNNNSNSGNGGSNSNSSSSKESKPGFFSSIFGKKDTPNNSSKNNNNNNNNNNSNRSNNNNGGASPTPTTPQNRQQQQQPQQQQQSRPVQQQQQQPQQQQPQGSFSPQLPAANRNPGGYYDQDFATPPPRPPTNNNGNSSNNNNNNNNSNNNPMNREELQDLMQALQLSSQHQQEAQRQQQRKQFMETKNDEELRVALEISRQQQQALQDQEEKDKKENDEAIKMSMKENVSKSERVSILRRRQLLMESSNAANANGTIVGNRNSVTRPSFSLPEEQENDSFTSGENGFDDNDGFDDSTAASAAVLRALNDTFSSELENELLQRAMKKSLAANKPTVDF